MVRKLTYQEKTYVFERLKNFIENNYIEEQLKQAKTRKEAVKLVKEILAFSGFGGPDMPMVMCEGLKGIHVEMPDGREARYKWEDFVDYILAEKKMKGVE